MSIDYTLNGGATWTTAPGTNVVLNPTNNTFVVTVPAGAGAGTYAAGQVMVRDTYAQSVNASAGRWVVSTFNPVSTPTSGTLVFGCETANPACIGFDSLGNVNKLIDIGGSGQYLTIGPTALQVTPGVVPVGAGVLGGTPLGPLSPYVRLGGSDASRTLVGLSETVNSAAFDPHANFFDAGPLGGPNDALITMINTSNVSTGAWTTTFGTYIDVHAPGGYCGGPIWGEFYPPPNGTSYINYCSAGRWHSGNFACQIGAGITSGSDTYFYNNNQSIGSSQWAVVTAQKNGTTFQWRINKGSWYNTTISSTAAFAAANFSWGGSFTTGVWMQSGNSYPYMGDFYFYSGALNSTDLGNVESMVGNSIGLAI